MNIYIYSDESGVLDKAHNRIFVFGGIVFLSKEEKDDAIHLYRNAEKQIQENNPGILGEVKASILTPKQKGKLFRSMNHFEKFGAIVYQDRLEDAVFLSKKQKQRYLDWLYKMAVKKKLNTLVQVGKIIPDEVERLVFYVDEHTTATNGVYELKESIEQEFKHGIVQYEYNRFIPPIFPDLKDVQLTYCDSKTTTLVRAADIIANQLYHAALNNNIKRLGDKKFSFYTHP